MSEVEQQLPSLVPREMSIEDIQSRLEKFNQLKSKVLGQHSTQIGNKSYILKSGWRIASVVFCISDEVLEKNRIDHDDGSFSIEYTVKATTPEGRTSIGVGSCSSLEKRNSGSRLEHDVNTMAHTRAKNRAISDVIGTGEVSAEEMEGTQAPQTDSSQELLDALLRDLAQLGYTGARPKTAYEAGVLLNKIRKGAKPT